MITGRTRLIWLGMLVFVITMLLLGLSSQQANASPVAQPPPPTNTPTEAPTPTETPIPPTIPPTEAPTETPIVTVPPGPSATPQTTPLTPTPKSTPKKSGGGKGGGAPPGPSGTPVNKGCVRSVGKDGVSLSTEPGFYQPHVQIAPVGDILYVVQGPVRTDNIQWWLLRTATGVEGWGNQDNITPDPGPCVAGSMQSDKSLPQTGNGVDGRLFLAILLAAMVIIIGIARRRLQVQPIAPDSDRGHDKNDFTN
jgi:hypothetical protein